MAVYNLSEPSTIFCEDTLRCSQNIIDADSPSPVLPMCPLESVIPIGQSSWTANLPISEGEAQWVGTKVDSFLDDYYYRIHVDPNVFDFGAVLSEQIETFIVWNSFFVTKSCSDIAKMFPDEFALAGTAAPFSLVALEYITYTLTVPKEGSAQFDASITYGFGAAGTRIVTLSGIRMIVFAWRPQEPVKESLEWLTDILTPVDGIGSEQRISIRQIPRQGFNFGILLESQKDQARLDAALFGWQKRYFGLPVWTEMVVHTATITATDTTIAVDTTNADFRDDSYAVIWKSLTEYEAIKIETIAANLLTLETPVVNTFTGVKLLMPLRIAQMNKTTSRRDHSTGLAEFDLAFAVKDNVLLTGYTPAITYKGLPVLTEATAVDPTQDKDIDSDSSIQDYESGDFDYFSDSEFNINSQSHLFYNDTKAECWSFRKFLHSLYGRQGMVWIPTHKEDMVQAETIHAADTSFQIENIGLAENMTFNALRMHMAFIFPDGSQIYKEITGIVESDENIEIVSIDTALGIEVAVGGCMLSFMHRCRLAADNIELTWPMAHQNECKTNFVAVKE